MTAPAAPESSERWRALALIAGAELLAMSLWFSGSAVAPALKAEWRLSDSAAAWLTLAVQLGFVAGTLVSALGNLPDVFSTRRLFAASAAPRRRRQRRPRPVGPRAPRAQSRCALPSGSSSPVSIRRA